MRQLLCYGLLIAAAGSAATPPDLATGLSKCAAVADSLQRLTCYDALAKEAGAGTATTQPATTATTAAPPKTSTPRAAVSARCQATTKRGTQCLRNAKAGSSYCWQHGG